MGPVNPKIGFKYTPPTEDVDGNPLPQGAIAKYQIGVGISPGVYTLIADDVEFENGQQVSPMNLFGQLSFGQKFAAVRVVLDDVHNNAMSEWSEEVQFEIRPVAPMPPTGFSVA